MTRECRPSQCLYLLLVRTGKGLVLVHFCFEENRANYRKAQITMGWGRFGSLGARDPGSDSSQGCVGTCSPSAPSFRATRGAAVVFDPTKL